MPRATTAATLLTCCVLLAGCSGSDPVPTASTPTPSITSTTAAAGPLDGLSALEVWERAKNDVAEAESVHVGGRFVDGQQTIVINLKMDNTGKAFGALSFNGNKITVRRLGETLYFRADHGFWAANADAATAETLTNKWIMVKKGYSEDMEQFFELTDMDFIVQDALELTSAQQKGLTLAPGITVDAQQTVGLAEQSADGDAKSSDFKTLYVSAADTVLPVNFAMSSDDRQYMKFRSWGEDFTVVAPAESIDLAAAD